MGKHLSKYQTEEDYNNNKDTHLKPHISFIIKPIKQMIYILKPYEERYFTIEALEDGLTASLSVNDCEYRIDNGSWNTLSANTNTPNINKGQTLSFRGNLIPNSGNSQKALDIQSFGIGSFTISKKCNLKGNIMSMLYGDDFVEQNDLSGKDYAFYCLFNNCRTLVDVSKLILPATTLAENCYNSMFWCCTNLTTPPKLPATILVDYCYSQMFRGCTSLTTAPELPAITLADSCYQNMFQNCTRLTKSPELQAPILTYRCYASMFDGCSNLNYITMLATDISANSCLYEWVYGVASSGTFIKHKNMTLLRNSDSGIPKGWTAEDYKNLITFYVDNIECQAEEGMTWEEWLTSEYSLFEKFSYATTFAEVFIDGKLFAITCLKGKLEQPVSLVAIINSEINYILVQVS